MLCRCLPSTGRPPAPPGHRRAIVTRNQLAQALHAPISPIPIWNSNLATRFERLLWAQEQQWRFFGKFVAMLTDDITREYGVKVGKDLERRSAHHRRNHSHSRIEVLGKAATVSVRSRRTGGKDSWRR
jgi:hypothetical protein